MGRQAGNGGVRPRAKYTAVAVGSSGRLHSGSDGRRFSAVYCRQHELHPVRCRRFDNANAESVLLAFDCDTSRIIHVQVDAERVRPLARHRRVAETSGVPRAVDDSAGAYSVCSQPPAHRSLASTGRGVDPKFVPSIAKLSCKANAAAPERFVPDEQPQQPREARLTGSILAVADERVVEIE
jgi:hypothetical protein